MIYDTNFLIALQGRHKRFTRAHAKAWISTHETGALYVPRVVAVEFAAGFVEDRHAAPLLGLFVVLGIRPEIKRQRCAGIEVPAKEAMKEFTGGK